jgi:hypothetical protein
MKVSYIMLYLSALSEAVARAAAAWTAAPRPPPGVAAAFFRMWYMVRICNMAGGVACPLWACPGYPRANFKK